MQGSIPKVLDDIATLRPTLFCGVPRVFDRIYGGIYEQVSSCRGGRVHTADSGQETQGFSRLVNAICKL